MQNIIHTAAIPVHTRNLKPIVLGEGAVLELEHQALMALDGPDPEPMFAREVVLKAPATQVPDEDVSTDEHPLM